MWFPFLHCTMSPLCWSEGSTFSKQDSYQHSHDCRHDKKHYMSNMTSYLQFPYNDQHLKEILVLNSLVWSAWNRCKISKYPVSGNPPPSVKSLHSVFPQGNDKQIRSILVSHNKPNNPKPWKDKARRRDVLSMKPIKEDFTPHGR